MAANAAGPVTIHWFRRDLRITDNASLSAAAARGGRLVCIYIVSSWSSTHRWTGPMRQDFLCGCLASLDANLRTLGGELIVREGPAVDVLLALAAESGASAIYYNRDPDPFGRAVEATLTAKAGNLEIRGFKDVCIHEQNEVLTATGTPFRVFTPYSRAWSKLPKPTLLGKLKSLSCVPLPSLPLPTLDHWNWKPEGNLVEAGERAARERLKTFLKNGLAHYGARRNTPAGTTTSRLSQDLRFGLLSIREVYHRCTEVANDLPPAGRTSAQTYVSELIWREFYINILWHFPEVLEQEFNAKYRGLPWPGRKADLERWCQGETGFPIVDAAMRQLNSTGFMHNRTRMITAMFLTKDLHLDWRFGESYFMRQLVDGEIASNNGGWQWSAGTGADAAPYFRIQNPWTQSLRFDPEGEYIKTWIPELRDVPANRLHTAPAPGTRLSSKYPAPMLDHSVARDKTLDLFKRFAGASEP
jgi:deoxyribodipyrimidine photo-lyase